MYDISKRYFFSFLFSFSRSTAAMVSLQHHQQSSPLKPTLVRCPKTHHQLAALEPLLNLPLLLKRFVQKNAILDGFRKNLSVESSFAVRESNSFTFAEFNFCESHPIVNFSERKCASVRNYGNHRFRKETF